MKKIKLNKPPRFLTHHLLLRPNCLARLKVPAYLTQHEADRLSAFLQALVLDAVENEDDWPYDIDPDGDLNEQEIEDELADGEEDENGLPMGEPHDQIP